MTTAEQIATAVAAEMTVEDVIGRDILVLSDNNSIGRARRIAARLGAVETTCCPSVLFGHHVITVWMD